ncbi:MAG: beta-lactamase family protein [Bacteroidetes bacterium]|nr:beta-lactamase family protein [Bacteroidota bacterium]
MTYKFKIICLQFSILCGFLLFWLTGISQSSFPEVDALINQNKKTLNNNFALLVWKDGKLAYQKQSPDFNGKTQAPIGNAGNWLTAALVMTFVDEGKLTLDDKISQYIPIFATYMKSYITVRNCLTNTTGIRSEEGIAKLFDKSKNTSLEDNVTAYAKKEIQANPGTEFFYSNIGFDIVARVLEVISKKSFDRIMQEKLLRPLKMRGTSFSNDEGGAINPAGGARSTGNDYINFLSMLLNNGMFAGKRILSEKSVAELETAQFTALPVKYSPKITEGLHYGYGDWIEETDSEGKGTLISCNNLYGTYPYIDKCKNYAAILILQKPQSELKKEFFGSLKDAIGGQMSSTCK